MHASARRLVSVLVLAVAATPFAAPGTAIAEDVNAGSATENYAHIHPQWSPDGTEILFYQWYSDRDRHTTLMIGNLKTGKTKPLTHDTFFNANPVFSADGTKIFYTSAQPSMRGDWEAWVLDRSTGESKQITHADARIGHTAVSPDGKTLVYQGKVEREGMSGFLTDIFAKNLETGDIRRLTDTDGNEFHPKFSADGKSIVFDRTTDGVQAIYQINLDGTNDHALLPADAAVKTSVPMLSPNGKWVAYSHGPSGDSTEGRNVHITNLENGKSLALTQYKGLGIAGVGWSPDSLKIAYSFGEDTSNYRLAVVDIESGTVSTPFAKPNKHAKTRHHK